MDSTSAFCYSQVCDENKVGIIVKVYSHQLKGGPGEKKACQLYLRNSAYLTGDETRHSQEYRIVYRQPTTGGRDYCGHRTWLNLVNERKPK